MPTHPTAAVSDPLSRRGAAWLIALGVALYLLPFYWPGLWVLSWVAIWPAVQIAQRSTPGQAAVRGYLLGLSIFVVGVYWLVHVTVIGWLLLSAYLGAYVGLFTFIIAGVGQRRRVPLFIAAPVFWVALEFVRCNLFSGFPWLQLGHSQHAFLPIIQVADFSGVYGVSFLLAMAGTAASEVPRLLRQPRRSPVGKTKCAWVSVALTAIAIVCALAYGYWRLNSLHIEQGPRIATVQGNIPQSVKLEYDFDQSVATLHKHIGLSRDAIAQRPDVIVWPETMSPGILNLPAEGFGTHGRLAELCRAELRKLAADASARLLIGTIAVEGVPIERCFNSAFFYSPEMSLLGRYDKVHLVPFGEYVPFRTQLPFLGWFVPTQTDLTPGRDMVLFEVLGHKFGVLICYEDVVPSLARQLRGKGADFVVNITNDGWFRGSAELEQHNGISVFRAVENRLGVVRAANTGMSSFISPTGRVYKALERDGKRREVEGTLVSNVVLCEAKTLYLQIGEGLAWLCVALAVGISIWGSLCRPNRG